MTIRLLDGQTRKKRALPGILTRDSSTPSSTPTANVVERCFNRLEQFRALATRYAKRAAYYRAEFVIAAVVLWLRTDLQDTP
jgi:hypothetical protein